MSISRTAGDFGTIAATVSPRRQGDDEASEGAAEIEEVRRLLASACRLALTDLLARDLDRLLDDLGRQGVGRRLEHYRDAEQVRERFTRLHSTVIECLDGQTLAPISRYSELIARDRYATGLDIGEVQAAFNIFEQSIRRAALPELPDEMQAEAMILVTLIRGTGKDALAPTWVSLVAASPHVREEAGLASTVVDSVIVLHSDVPRDVLEGFAEEALAKTRAAHVQGHRLPLAQHDVRDKATEWKRQHQQVDSG